MDVSFERQIECARRIARVLVATACMQLSGAAYFIVQGITGNPLSDWWYGGVYAAPFGFALGLIWQVHADPSVIREDRDVLLAFGTVITVLPMVALLSEGSGLVPGT